MDLEAILQGNTEHLVLLYKEKSGREQFRFSTEIEVYNGIKHL